MWLGEDADKISASLSSFGELFPWKHLSQENWPVLRSWCDACALLQIAGWRRERCFNKDSCNQMWFWAPHILEVEKAWKFMQLLVQGSVQIVPSSIIFCLVWVKAFFIDFLFSPPRVVVLLPQEVGLPILVWGSRHKPGTPRLCCCVAIFPAVLG